MKMLKQFVTAAFIVSAAIMFNACSEEEEKPKTAPDGALIATVAGKAWTSKIAGAVLLNGSITITGEAGDGSYLVLSVEGITAGTYPVSGIVDETTPMNVVSFTPSGADVLTNPTYASTYYGATAIGEVKLTEVDLVNKTVTGTFTCKVKRSVPQVEEMEIKSGSFTKIPYEDEPEPSPDDEFSAKVGGTVMVPSTIGAVEGFGRITVNASGTASIALSLDATTGVGTFELGPMASDYYAMVVKGGNTYESVSGTVNVTLHDKVNDRIEGTFSFTAELFPLGGSPISVTEGSFAVSY